MGEATVRTWAEGRRPGPALVLSDGALATGDGPPLIGCEPALHVVLCVQGRQQPARGDIASCRRPGR